MHVEKQCSSPLRGVYVYGYTFINLMNAEKRKGGGDKGDGGNSN